MAPKSNFKKPAQRVSSIEDGQDETLLSSVIDSEDADDQPLHRTKAERGPLSPVVITVVAENITSTGPRVGEWRWSDAFPNTPYQRGVVVTVPAYVGEHLAERGAAVISQR